jgi:hypothetical protein
VDIVILFNFILVGQPLDDLGDDLQERVHRFVVVHRFSSPAGA